MAVSQAVQVDFDERCALCSHSSGVNQTKVDKEPEKLENQIQKKPLKEETGKERGGRKENELKDTLGNHVSEAG